MLWYGPICSLSCSFVHSSFSASKKSMRPPSTRTSPFRSGNQDGCAVPGRHALQFRQRGPLVLDHVITMHQPRGALVQVENPSGRIDGVVVIGVANGSLAGLRIAFPPTR